MDQLIHLVLRNGDQWLLFPSVLGEERIYHAQGPMEAQELIAWWIGQTATTQLRRILLDRMPMVLMRRRIQFGSILGDLDDGTNGQQTASPPIFTAPPDDDTAPENRLGTPTG